MASGESKPLFFTLLLICAIAVIAGFWISTNPQFVQIRDYGNSTIYAGIGGIILVFIFRKYL